MGENEGFPLSHMLTDFNSIHTSLLLENEYLKNKKEYRKKLCDEYVAVTKYITYLEDLQKEKIGREKLINDSIESAWNTQLLLKEHKSSLLKELKMEQKGTAEWKNKHDSIISKYEKTWEHYKGIYNKLPVSRERTKVQVEFKLKHIKLMQFQVEITEIKRKCLCLVQVREKKKRLEVVKLAEAYKDREVFSKKIAALGQEIRKLRDEVDVKKTEKQRLINVRVRNQNENSAQQDTLANLIQKTVMDTPCLTVPQLQLPPWYSPPRKIPYLEKRSTNNMSVAVGTGASQIVDMLARDVRNILNPSGGFQVRKQNGGEATVPPLPSSVVATHAEATEKSRQEVAESIATVHDGNEPQVLPAACAMDQPQADPGQSNFPPDHCMDEAPELTSAEDHQSSAHEETTTVSSTQQAAAPVNTTEVVDVRAAGGCVTPESAVQKIGAGCMTGSRGDYRQSTLGITDRPTSDNRVLTSQAFTMEKTVHSDQVQPVTNIEDDDADMNVDVPRYPSPVAGENVAGLDHTSEGDQYQDDCHFTASSEDICCVLSPQGDFLMTSPDETIALKSPPFVMSPGFQTANNDLFGGLSGQQSNTGFTFSFGAANTGSGAAERNKPNEGFQFSFDKKTPSRSLFQLF